MCVPVSSEGIIQGDFKKQTVLKVKACPVRCTLKCVIEEVEPIRSRGGGVRVPPRNYAFGSAMTDTKTHPCVARLTPPLPTALQILPRCF